MTITPTQLDDAEAIARAATQGECWYIGSDGCIYAGQPSDEYGECNDVLIADMSCDMPWNRKHIARFSPAFALELIEEVRKLQRINANFRQTTLAAGEGIAELTKERDEVRGILRDWLKAYDDCGPNNGPSLTEDECAERARAALAAKTEGGGDE